MSTAIRRLGFSLLGISALCLAALPALGDVPGEQSDPNFPQPGTLNYVRGSAYLQGRLLNGANLGNQDLAPGQVLNTTTGKAEVLLTPGVFLRLDDHSSVKMLSPDISHTRIEVLSGEAGIEVDQMQPQNDLEIVDQGVTTRMVQRGFYEFSANPARVRVFTGEAQVETGNGNHQDVKKNHEMILGVDARPQSFNSGKAEDALFNWSKLRSHDLAEASRQYAGEYGYAGAPGWYWNPWTPGWDFAWGPRWGWGAPGWGWGAGWGWGPAWGWGGPAFWGGPVFHYRLRPWR
jgi:hypothetical protein